MKTPLIAFAFLCTTPLFGTDTAPSMTDVKIGIRVMTKKLYTAQDPAVCSTTRKEFYSELPPLTVAPSVFSECGFHPLLCGANICFKTEGDEKQSRALYAALTALCASLSAPDSGKRSGAGFTGDES